MFKKKEMTQEEWLWMGIEKKWCTEVACYSHDALDLTEEEVEAFDQGFDDCIPVVRLWQLKEY